MIILASKSPRRKELLEKHHVDFMIDTVETSEVFNKNLKLEDALLDVAFQKVLPVFEKHQNDLIIGADTIVVCDNKVLGKPKDFNEAYNMLRLLSNKSHYVMTGVIIKSQEIDIRFVDKTKVTFKDLTDQEIIEYISTENVYDKAGSYAIQEGASKFVLNVDGSMNNVIGLPVERVVEELKKHELI